MGRLHEALVEIEGREVPDVKAVGRHPAEDWERNPKFGLVKGEPYEWTIAIYWARNYDGKFRSVYNGDDARRLDEILSAPGYGH
jgi:hypothetical protein